MTIRTLTQSTDMMTVEVGDVLSFVILDRWIEFYNPHVADGAGLEPTYQGLTPDKYQVFKVINGAATLLNEGATGTGGPSSSAERDIDSTQVQDQFVFAPDAATQYVVTEPDFPLSGQTGLIVVYNTSGDDDQYIIPFRVVYNKFLHEKLDSYITTEAPNSIMGRLLTCERNQTDVIMPRLRRALGLLGEHQMVDGFLYDDDGNITECRIRIFDNETNRDDADPWVDRQNDPDTAPSLDTGEEARYIVTATNLLPRNLRTLYNQAITVDPPDDQYGDMGDGVPGTTNGSVL